MPMIYCGVCNAELIREEKWDGSYIFICPKCQREKSRSKKLPEKDCYGFKSWATTTITEHEKLQEKESEFK
jgi:DNA-directed RNA polymerase subunit M/transcription elongation factor TFIIS